MQLKNMGIKGLLLDLDDTLVSFAHKEPTPSLCTWLEHVQDEGFKIVIISNNHRLRVDNFARSLYIPYIYKAHKPLRVSFIKSLKILNINANEAAIIGDQLLTDILGGNLMGLHTILVKPIALRKGLWPYINRNLERLLFYLLFRFYGQRRDYL